jgi:hypothetical protein
MQKFFASVLTAVIKELLTGNPDATNEEVLAVVKGFVHDAVQEAEQQSVDRIDAMDGKMGNLQEQLTAIPGQIIGGIESSILGPINDILNKINPLGGLFGPR